MKSTLENLRCWQALAISANFAIPSRTIKVVVVVVAFLILFRINYSFFVTLGLSGSA